MKILCDQLIQGTILEANIVMQSRTVRCFCGVVRNQSKKKHRENARVICNVIPVEPFKDLLPKPLMTLLKFELFPDEDDVIAQRQKLVVDVHYEDIIRIVKRGPEQSALDSVHGRRWHRRIHFALIDSMMVAKQFGVDVDRIVNNEVSKHYYHFNTVHPNVKIDRLVALLQQNIGLSSSRLSKKRIKRIINQNITRILSH